MDDRIKRRQVMVLAAGMFIFTLGFGIIIPVMPYYASGLGATALDLGLLMATFSAMQFVCAPFWGVISDRWGRRPVIMIGLAGFGLSFTVTALSSQPWALSLSGSIGHVTGLTPHVGVLFISEIIGGCISSGIYPATLAYIADISTPGERGSLMGTMGAASGLGVIVGPAISGFLTAGGLTLPFFVTAGIGFTTAILSYFFLPETRVPGPRAKERKVPMLSVLRSSLAFVFLLALLIGFAAALMDGTFGYFLMGKFGLSDQVAAMPVLDSLLMGSTVWMTGPGVMGFVFTAMGITGILCQGLIVGKAMKRFGEEMTIVLGLVIYSIGLVTIYIAGGLLTLALFACVIEVGFCLIFPSLNTLVSKRADHDRQGAMQGVMGSFSSLGRMAGPPVGGVLYAVSIALPYMVSAVLGFIAAGAMYYFTISGRKNKAPEQPANPPLKT